MEAVAGWPLVVNSNAGGSTRQPVRGLSETIDGDEGVLGRHLRWRRSDFAFLDDGDGVGDVGDLVTLGAAFECYVDDENDANDVATL